MSTPARVLEEGDVRRLLRHVCRLRHGARNTVIVLLSFKAGLRAAEIAGLTWPMLLRPDGRVDRTMLVAASIAKGGSARRVPVSPTLRLALLRLQAWEGWPREGPVVRSERGRHMTAGSIVNWFAEAYAALGMTGCSSHSGRRTFITRSARVLHRTGGSLRDIQELAGHRSLTTTERYIAGDRAAQHRLVRLV